MNDGGLMSRAKPVLGLAAMPVLLSIDVCLGGSPRETFLASGILQIIACAVIVWCTLDRDFCRLSKPALWLLGLVSLVGLIGIFQLVPLPFQVWAHLPGRAFVTDGFSAAHIAAGWQPMSLAPEETVYALLRFLPAVAIFLLAAKMPWRPLTSWLRWTIPLLAAISVVIGFAQLTFPNTAVLHFFEDADRGKPTGLMAIINHQATLQLMALPFIAALFARLRSRRGYDDADQARAVIALVLVLLIIAGLIACGSFAGYVLLAPVVASSCFIIFTGGFSKRLVVATIMLGVALAAIALVIASSPMLNDLGGTDFSKDPASRRDIYERTWTAIGDYFPFGSGLGSFVAVYPRYEDPGAVTTTFINHAHDEILELGLELGLAGIAIAIAAIVWWCVMSVEVWRSQEPGTLMRRAASVALGAVIAHSIVDFPLRTEAIACLSAMCLGLLASGPSARVAISDAADEERIHHKHIQI